MGVRGKQLVETAFRDVARGEPTALAGKALRFGRERLPVELWPPLLIDPRNTADEVVRLPEKPSLDVSYDSPFHDGLPRQLANFEGTISSPENAVYVYEGADVSGRYPTARIDGEYLLPSWFGVDTAFFLHQEKFLKRTLPLASAIRDAVLDPEPARRLDSAFLLLGERGSYRYGWFHETLPKLRWYEEYCTVTGESPTLIVNSPLRPYQRQTLEWMGYGADSWLEQGREVTHVDRLVVAPHPIRLEGNPSRGFATEVGWAAGRILSNLPSPSEASPERVYVSRADATRRRVVNEGEVMDVLRPRGFERHEPGHRSIESQARLFAGADVVVGPHGLGFFNLMYCEEGTGFVELFAPDGVDESYFVVANERDMDYEYLVCEPVDDGTHDRPINRDVRVDVDRLAEVMDHVLHASARR